MIVPEILIFFSFFALFCHLFYTMSVVEDALGLLLESMLLPGRMPATAESQRCLACDDLRKFYPFGWWPSMMKVTIVTEPVLWPIAYIQQKKSKSTLKPLCLPKTCKDDYFNCINTLADDVDIRLVN